MEVIGFEGSWGADSSIVNRAVAALRAGSRVVNPFSGQEISEEEFNYLVEEGHASSLPVPLAVPVRAEKALLEVLCVNTAYPFAGVAFVDPSRVIVLGAVVVGTVHYYLMEQKELNKHARMVGNKIFEVVRRNPKDTDKARILANIGMVLNAHDPKVAAVDVLGSRMRANALRICDALMRSDEDRRTFLSGCRRLGLPV